MGSNQSQEEANHSSSPSSISPQSSSISSSSPPYPSLTPSGFVPPHCDEFCCYQTAYDCCGRPIVIVRRYRRVGVAGAVPNNTFNPRLTTMTMAPPRASTANPSFDQNQPHPLL